MGIEPKCSVCALGFFSIGGIVHYFGCVDDVGHYHFVPGDPGCRPIKSNYYKAPFFPECDSGFCPKHTRKQGVVCLTHQDGWTILSFWDNSVDTRPGSHSTFMVEGKLDKDAMIAKAKELFPTIWQRYAFEVQ